MTPMQHNAEPIEVPIDTLTEVAGNALRKLGLAGTDASTVLDVLMYGQLRGSSQGLIKIVEQTVCPTPGAGPITKHQQLPAMAHLHANGNVGMVVMSKACDLLLECAPLTGIAAVSTVGTATSTGAIGYYARKLADAGLVGIVMAGSPKTTALHGGVDPLIGTNPVALAMPGDDEPFVIDFASAATTVFDLIAARGANRPIADDLAFDAAGQPTTDPGAVLDGGAIKTFGGAKGSALGLIVE